VLIFKFSALFCQLSLNMLGRQQRLILLVAKDQQVLQTITIEKYLYPYALRGCVRPLKIVPLNNLYCAAQSFLISPMFTILRHFLPPRQKLTDFNTFRSKYLIPLIIWYQVVIKLFTINLLSSLWAQVKPKWDVQHWGFGSLF
jgi:hypothetical protein